MITIEKISKKLNDLFNGTDAEVSREITPFSDKYFFSVATEGFELKHIFDMKSGKNFIPVFVSSQGGEFNPIPNLGEYSLNTRIVVYFPVRFKQDFYETFIPFLQDTFVGKVLSFEGEKTLCNVSVPQMGEIDTYSVKEFSQFIVNTYKMPITVSEQWMSMEFSLFLSTSTHFYDFILGNNTEIELTYKGIKNKIIFDNSSFEMNTSQSSEQLLGTKISKSTITSTGDAMSLSFYIKGSNIVDSVLLADLFNGSTQNENIDVKISFGTRTFTYQAVINSIGLSIELGDFLKFQMSLSRRK